MAGGTGTNFSGGLIVSLVGHSLLAYCMFYKFAPNFEELGKPIIYSITLEGGKTLGGKSQVSKKDEKVPLAPPKNVSQKNPDKALEVDQKTNPQERPLEVKDAEVSLAAKTPVPTPPPVASKAPEVKAEKAQATAVPKKEPSKKPTPKPPTQAEINKQYQQAMQRYQGESSESTGQGFGAAKLGGQGMGGGVQRPPEFFIYRDLLRTQIRKGWVWADSSAPLTTWVTFEISPRGEVSNVRIAKSSGNIGFDESIERAVLKASPLPAPPANVYQFFSSVRMNFDPRE